MNLFISYFPAVPVYIIAAYSYVVRSGIPTEAYVSHRIELRRQIGGRCGRLLLNQPCIDIINISIMEPGIHIIWAVIVAIGKGYVIVDIWPDQLKLRDKSADGARRPIRCVKGFHIRPEFKPRFSIYRFAKRGKPLGNGIHCLSSGAYSVLRTENIPRSKT